MPPMVGGIFYEHGHRMVATFVGLLTVILAVWIWRSDDRTWMKRLGWAALGAVIVQGVLGGLTVIYLLPLPVSVAHACLAQTFFCLLIAIALFTSPGWRHGYPQLEETKSIRSLAVMTTAAVYLQLILGAFMRHTKSGLAIPDFPLHFGRLIPPLDSGPVVIHFAHRAWATVVLTLILYTAYRVSMEYGAETRLFRPAMAMAGLVSTQVFLGALTIWTEKAVIPTTAHVMTGALTLGASVLLTLRVFAMVRPTGTAATASRLKESTV